jgi:hypothetical protein
MFGNGEGKEMRSVAKREAEEGVTAFDWNF